MNKSVLRGLSVAVLVVVCAPLLIRAIAADASLPGETWETTSQPTMEGMPPGFRLPVTRLTQCLAKNRTEPPVAPSPQGTCTSSNVQRTETKVTWAMQCTGPTMTGTGEIVYSADRKSYTGVIKFMGAQGAMTINLTGTKGADCPNPR
jgi:Protein of unknown function (DUF3617)